MTTRNILTIGEACRLLSAALGRFVPPAEFKSAAASLGVEAAMIYDWHDCYDVSDIDAIHEHLRRPTTAIDGAGIGQRRGIS